MNEIVEAIAPKIRERLSIGGLAACKTHCSYGHEFSPENTRLGPDGRRYCRACVRRRWHERVARAALRSLGEKA